MAVRLVLASGSPRRADILRQLGLDPEVLPADVDEVYLPGESPSEHVDRLAQAKAAYVAGERVDALVVGGDTVVLDEGRVLGKPKDVDEAVEMLLRLAGRPHQVLTGLALAGAHGVVSGVTGTSVRFRDFDEATARRYAETGEPMDKAGSYGIQGLGAALVEGLDGDYYSVVGFPVGTFLDLLERAGWRYNFGEIDRVPG
jgi:septum formation protein